MQTVTQTPTLTVTQTPTLTVTRTRTLTVTLTQMLTVTLTAMAARMAKPATTQLRATTTQLNRCLADGEQPLWTACDWYAQPGGSGILMDNETVRLRESGVEVVHE